MPFSLKDVNDLGLCGTCDNSHIRRGERAMDTEVMCNWLHPTQRVTYIIRKCSGYEEKGKPSRHDMERIGWVLEVKGGKVIGFRPPRKQEDE